MFELDKERFGEFVASQRKKKGYTQREMAQKLFVSDKTVSKWERSAGMPDISFLIPLADISGQASGKNCQFTMTRIRSAPTATAYSA